MQGDDPLKSPFALVARWSANGPSARGSVLHRSLGLKQGVGDRGPDYGTLGFTSVLVLECVVRKVSADAGSGLVRGPDTRVAEVADVIGQKKNLSSWIIHTDQPGSNLPHSTECISVYQAQVQAFAVGA